MSLRASGTVVWPLLATMACRPDLTSPDANPGGSTTAEDTYADIADAADTSTSGPGGGSPEGTGDSGAAAPSTDGGLVPSKGAADSSSTTDGATECGNGLIEGDESCDGVDLGGSTCGDIGFPLGGQLTCQSDCTYDTSRCILPAGVGDLIFSEYVEGTYPRKALETANIGATALDLNACAVTVYYNQGPAMSTTLLGGVVAHDGVFTICTEVVSEATSCDVLVANAWFNGNDTVELKCSGIVIDVLGEYGANPTIEWLSGGVGTADETLRRSCDVATGDIDGTNLFDPSSEWLSFPIDDLTDLGQYVCP